MPRDDALNIYTDGSMLPSPRAGGIGILFMIVNEAGEEEIIKTADRPGFKQSTNQEMELEACIVAIEEALDDPDLSRYTRIEIHTDSKYVQENQNNLKFVWPKTRWKNRTTGRPILNVPHWKRLLKLLQRASRERKYVRFNWVPGKSDAYTKAVDKAAKRSAKIPLREPRSVVSVRKKITEKKTEIGSVKMRGQLMAIRVITAQYLGSPHRLWKYKYEVLSGDSEFFGNVDEIFSELYLRDGHHYEVRANEDTKNPRIVAEVRELDR